MGSNIQCQSSSPSQFIQRLSHGQASRSIRFVGAPKTLRTEERMDTSMAQGPVDEKQGVTGVWSPVDVHSFGSWW